MFWVGVAVIFGGHYILSLAFANMTIGITMTWTAVVIGIIMIFIMAFLGGKDILGMVKASKAAEVKLKAEK